MDTFPIAAPWPPFQSLSRVTLAIALRLFVGLEREWRGKEAGLRTFAFVALLAALRYGALFVVLEISSEAAQRFLGQAGFYTVTALGGWCPAPRRWRPRRRSRPRGGSRLRLPRSAP